jgi:NTP pyrophosphatase (non-canonical NTP hydrolase)
MDEPRLGSMSLDVVYVEIERERQRTRTRVNDGELPSHMEELSVQDRLAVLMEEIGEVAECIKHGRGLKPRLGWSGGEREIKLYDELVQVASITTDWLLCPPNLGSYLD